MRLGDPESASWASQLLGRSEVEEHRASASLDSDELSDRGSLSTMRQTKPVVLDSEIGDLPPLTGFLRLSGLPIARVTIPRGHMDRSDIADPTVPLAVATETRAGGSPSAPFPAGGGRVIDPDHDRTAGGAL